MKKVRYAIGAAGVAPALGLMIPAANAATTVAHAPKNPAKTVSFEHGNKPDVKCGSNKIQGVFSANGRFHGAVNFSGVNCIHAQWASLNFAKTGLTERTRFYSGNGTLERTTYQAGRIFHSPTYTFWSSVPNLNALRVCQALVLNSNHNTVKYGPLCYTV